MAIVTRLPLSDRLELQAEVGLQRRRAEISTWMPVCLGSISVPCEPGAAEGVAITSLQLPLLLRAHLGVAGPVRFFALGGPALDIRLGCSRSGGYDPGRACATYSIGGETDERAGYQRSDLSAVGGVGASRSNVSLELRAAVGTSDVVRGGDSRLSGTQFRSLMMRLTLWRPGSR